MGSAVTIKRGDTARKLEDTLTFNGAAINLAASTVQVVFKSFETGAVTKRAATITDAAAGKVEYQFVVADTAIAGTFLVEWEITFPGGAVLTVPDNDFHTLKILADLG